MGIAPSTITTIKSTLSNYISSTSRSRSRYDKILLISNSTIRKEAILWRTGRFGIFDKCTICSSFFNRFHIMECSILDPSLFSFSFLNSFEDCKRLMGTMKFTYLDHCLNIGNYELFSYCINLIKSKLCRRLWELLFMLLFFFILLFFIFDCFLCFVYILYGIYHLSFNKRTIIPNPIVWILEIINYLVIVLV